MRPAQLRKLTVKQLAKASAESWDDAGALAGILAELRRRPSDSQIDTLIRSNARRLSTLTYSALDQAEDGAFGAKEEEGSDAPPSRQRRILLAALLTGAAAGVMIVLLGLPRDLFAPLLGPRPPGPQVSGATALTGGPHQSPAAEAPRSVGTRLPGPTMTLDEARPRPDDARSGERRNLAAAEAEAIRLQSLRLRSGPVLYLAEAGIRIGPQQFQCFVSTSDPRRCGSDVSHAAERPGAQPRPRAAVEPHTSPARGPVPPSGTERSRSASSQDGSTSARRMAAATGKPEEPGSLAAVTGAGEPQDAAGEECTGAAANSRLVFVMDGSLSMGLPADLDPAIEDRLDEGIRNQDDESRRQYRALLAEPGPKRISRAGDAFDAATRDLPESVELGLVAFRECRDIRTFGIFASAQRGAAIDAVRNLMPQGRTPLAESLRHAAQLLDDGPSAIVMLTDGREFCGGDPCAAATEIKAEHPETSIHVVDLGGQARAECIAQATGGRSYAPAMGDDLGRVLSQAFRGAVQCRSASASPVRSPR